jgi:hypothetical protein
VHARSVDESRQRASAPRSGTIAGVGRRGEGDEEGAEDADKYRRFIEGVAAGGRGVGSIASSRPANTRAASRWSTAYAGPVMPRRTRGATWLVTGIVGVSLGLACGGRNRNFCRNYAETVSECCSEYEYAHLRAICDQDVGVAGSIGVSCARSVRELYICAEARACASECQEESPDPCASQRQTMLGVCAESPPPPPEP